MHSFLFCTSFIDKNDIRFDPLRYRKWIDYYAALKESLGIDHIFMIDDGSADPSLEQSAPVNIISAEDELPDELPNKINIITFKEHLGRPSIEEHLGWWRSFTWSVKLAEKYGFEKIVHIESDFYIVSERLINFIHSMDKGWTSLFSSHFNFPETAIQIICKDSFDLLESARQKATAANYRITQLAEHTLPFTNICKDFTGDRIGEMRVLKQWVFDENEIRELDFYGQLPTNVRPFSALEFQQLKNSIDTTVTTDDNFNADAMISILLQNNMIITP
jgi:hypothetical protein